MRTTLAAHLPRLCCPHTRQPLAQIDGHLVTPDGAHRYALSAAGVPLFAEQPTRRESRIQQAHYDRVGAEYVQNLHYPHTQEYVKLVDRLLMQALPEGPLGVVGEICCGGGEGLRLLQRRADDLDGMIGVDISSRMLEAAVRADEHDRVLYVQADATALPLADESLDHVLMLGGIHHINDRAGLYAEICRVLKPGGRLFFREPVNDFAPWRWLRALVYRLSPQLDADTERPLRFCDSDSSLRAAGLELHRWRTTGFLGFCLFVNSDVLVFNRLLRFVPGIRYVSRLAARLDDRLVRLPGLRRSGLQVVGTAVKPATPRIPQPLPAAA